MVLLGVVEGVSPTLEEAAQTLRADRWRTFTHGHAAADAARASPTRSWSASSRASPTSAIRSCSAATSGVLSTEIFFAVVGAQFDHGRAAALALLLLGFALGAFFAAARMRGRHGPTPPISGKGDARPADAAAARRAPRRAAGSRCRGSPSRCVALRLRLRRRLREDVGPRLHADARALRQGVLASNAAPHGLIWSGAAWNSFFTTVKLAAHRRAAHRRARPARWPGCWRASGSPAAGVLEFAAMLAFAVPGHGDRRQPTSSPSTCRRSSSPAPALIIVLCFVFRNMPVGVRAGMAAMSQIDRSLDEASVTLRGRRAADAALRRAAAAAAGDRRRAGLRLRARDDDGAAP